MHPDMRLQLDDFAVFVANWRVTSPTNLRRSRRRSIIGLDSFVLRDDNPVERETVRQSLPEVDVILAARGPGGCIARTL